MSSSELSDLSSALSSEDENVVEALSSAGKLHHYFEKGSVVTEQASPPAKRKRPASPPHEYVLADNPDIAVSPKTIYDGAAYNRGLYFKNRVAYASVV